MELGVVPMIVPNTIVLFCNNSEAITQSKVLTNQWKGKQIERKYYLIRDIV